MSRIRSIKPEWPEDKKLQAAGDAARVLSAALITMADDHGRLCVSIGKLAGHVWTLELESAPGPTLAKTKEALGLLVGMGFVRAYQVGKETYLQITKWTDHQKVDHPAPSRLPTPPPIPEYTEDDSGIRETLPKSSRGRREVLAPDLGSGIRDLGPRTEDSSDALASEPPSGFVKFLGSTWPDVRRPSEFEKACREAYPNVDLLAEAKKARAWEVANRTKKAHAPFLHRWFAKAQDQPASRGDVGRAGYGAPKTPPQYHEKARIKTADELEAMAQESIRLQRQAEERR